MRCMPVTMPKKMSLVAHAWHDSKVAVLNLFQNEIHMEHCVIALLHFSSIDMTFVFSPMPVTYS